MLVSHIRVMFANSIAVTTFYNCFLTTKTEDTKKREEKKCCELSVIAETHNSQLLLERASSTSALAGRADCFGMVK